MIIRVGCGANPNTRLQCDLLTAEKVGRFASTFLQQFLVLFYFSLSKSVWFPEECLNNFGRLPPTFLLFFVIKIGLTSGGLPIISSVLFFISKISVDFQRNSSSFLLFHFSLSKNSVDFRRIPTSFREISPIINNIFSDCIFKF